MKKWISINNRILFVFILLLIAVIGGTFAWFTYRSKESALVLTIGDINDTQIKLSPYQINDVMAPVPSYTDGVSSNVEITTRDRSTIVVLYYKVNQLDPALIDNGLAYTVVESTSGNIVESGYFSDLIDTSEEDLPDKIIIFQKDTEIDSNINYQVYLWLDSNSPAGDQSEVQNTTLDVELNASIGSIIISGTNTIGETLTADVAGSGNGVTYTYQWYSNTTNSTTGGTQLTEATSNNTYTIASGLADKYIYVVVKSDEGMTPDKTYTDITDSDNNITEIVDRKNATLTVTPNTLNLTYPMDNVPTLSYTYNGDGEVSCNSSNPSAVTCVVDSDNNKVIVTPHGGGSNITISLSATQSDDYKAATSENVNVTITSLIYQVTYDYATNGGSSSSLTSADVAYGNNIDLTPVATKDDWDFLGWNTDKNATTGIDSLSMGNNSVTLYAIYKRDSSATIYYYNGSNVATVNTTCTSYNNDYCTYTIPDSVRYSKGPESLNYLGVASSINSASIVETTPYNIDTYYAVYQENKNVNIIYNSNNQGGLTISTATINGYTNAIYDGSIYGVNYSTIDVPDAVRNSKGIYKTDYYSVCSRTTTMSSTYCSTTPTTANTTYYTNYSNSVTVYRPTSTTDNRITTQNLYRNEYFSSSSAMTARLSSSNTTTTTASITRVSGWNLTGLDESLNTTTVSYSSVANAANSDYRTLYAVFDKEIAITYDVNGGSGTISNSTGTVYWYPTSTSSTTKTATSITITSTIPTRDGYDFLGWSTSSTATSASHTPGSSYTTFTDNKTLYAVWIKKTYTISYNMNGGSGTIANQTKTHGTDLTLSSTKPTREGYNFLGWSTSPSATEKTYDAGDKYTTDASNTLYAVWSKKTYTISYDMNGGSGTIENQTKTHGTDLTLSSTKPTRAGYDFLGWSVDSSATEATYKSGDKYTTDASDTLYAVWSKKKYAVKYNMCSGTGGPSAQTKIYGEDLTLSSTKPTRSGWTFLGWNTTGCDQTSYDYAAGGTYSTNAAIDLYAVWRKTYTVTFTTNDYVTAGSSTKTCNIYKSGNSCTVTLATITPDTNYYAVGWNTEAPSYNSTSTYAAGSSYTVSSSHKLYAYGFKKNYQITLSSKTYYAPTFKEAVAYGAGSTIKMLQNVTESTSTILTSGTYSFNTNGMTYTTSGGNGIIHVQGATLTISGSGTIVQGGTAQSPLNINSGTLTINGPTIQSTETSATSIAVNVSGGTTNFKSGTLLARSYGIFVKATEATATVNVSGGTINTHTNGANNYVAGIGVDSATTKTVQVSVTGGTIISRGYGIINSSSKSTINITGGYVESVNTHALYNNTNAGVISLGSGQSNSTTVKLRIASQSSSAIYIASGASVNVQVGAYIYTGGSSGIYNLGTLNLYGGRIYYTNNGSGSMMTGTGTKNLQGTWAGATGSYSYVFNGFPDLGIFPNAYSYRSA